MKKVLVFYASYGGGHLSAAKSIKQYIDENFDNTQTELVDCIKYINKSLDKLTTGAYREMAKKAPWAWKKVYYNSQKGLLGKISSGTNKLMAKKIFKLFKDFEPDIVISTHPFGSQMTSYLKKKNKTNCKLATVMTDFAPHDQWLVGNKYVDFYFVSNSSMKDLMVTSGIPSNKIHVTGIPVVKGFSKSYDKEKILNDYGFSKDKKTILFFGGGAFGLGKEKTVEILNVLAKSQVPIQVIAISGKNAKMQQEFENIVSVNSKTDSIKVLSFTDKVPELMSISDLVITKPGGLTVSESLVSHLPIVVINPIPGQEEENAKFLEDSGVALWIKKDTPLEKTFNNLLSDDNKLLKMKQKAIEIAKPDSTKNICNICLE